jgi:protease I
MPNKLDGVRVAIVVADGFEQVELTEPKKALENAGAETHFISPNPDTVTAWNYTNWGDEFPVDEPLADAMAGEYDALLLPGGVMNPDKLRINPDALKFVKLFIATGKPIASICHGPWTLIDAEGVKNRTMTSWPSLQTDLRNAGANWVDEECVRDGNMVTSRKPADLPAFNAAIIEVFAEFCQHA